MITKNPMQLKAFIKKKAVEKNISAQLVMQNYMLERLLERIALSRYRRNFIIKGGFLISAIVGLDTDDYPGIRVALKANYPPIRVPLSVDVTTGDIITPREIEVTFSLLFDDRTIRVFAYNLETVLAEKIETVLSRNIANTRPRDFYDIYILCALRGTECNKETLRQAMERTVDKRGSCSVLENYREILADIRASEQMQNLWKKYQRGFDYARAISFDMACDSIAQIMEYGISEEKNI